MEVINYEDNKVLETIRNTIAQGATNEELTMFVELCKAGGLNPFRRDAWFIKVGNRPQIMVGINGYLAVANRHPQFDGMEIDIETDGQGVPLKATAKVYRKDRKYPSTGIALMKEFKKDTPIWRSMPSVMLTKVAKCIAIREAFSLELGGTYSDVEMPSEYSPKAVDVSPTIDPRVKAADTIESIARTWWYDLEKIDEGKRDEAQQYAFDEGALRDPETKLYYSSRALKLLKNAQVAAPKKAGKGDDTDKLPDGWGDSLQTSAAK